MSILIGHASISENGTINGSPGDSTGKEVCIREFYSKPWDFMAIHPDATVREKHAKAIEAACANDNIGYGQNDRNTLNTLAKAVGYNLSKVGKCNCDCSSLQNVAAVASGAPGVTYGSNGWTTSTMKSALQKAGYIIITDTAYLTSGEYCVRGAIYVKSSSHTVCGLTNGSKASQTLKKAGISADSGSAGSSASSGTGSSSGALEYKVGDVVEFTGTKHYTSSYSSGTAKNCKGGKAKVTQISPGQPHPYHLQAVNGSGATVNGWVNAADIKKATSSGTTGGTSATLQLKVGDVVDFTGTTHYTSSYAAGTAKSCKPGKAKVTQISPGQPHPYHLQAVNGSGATVNGWVNAADIKGAATSGIITAGKTVKVKSTATKYATGQTIPSWVKGKTYTVQQIADSRALLKEITSWVNISDLELA